MNIISIIYGPWPIWWIMHTWSQGGGYLNNAYGTLKKNMYMYFIEEYCTFSGWISNKDNGSMKIVGGTMRSIYGTMIINGGTMSSIYGCWQGVLDTLVVHHLGFRASSKTRRKEKMARKAENRTFCIFCVTFF